MVLLPVVYRQCWFVKTLLLEELGRGHFDECSLILFHVEPRFQEHYVEVSSGALIWFFGWMNFDFEVWIWSE